MKPCDPIVLAVIGCVAAAPMAIAQTTPANTGSASQPSQSPSRAGQQPTDTTTYGAHKQHTQGLPSTAVPRTDSSWNSQRQPSKTQ